jgi:hypothetical protein
MKLLNITIFLTYIMVLSPSLIKAIEKIVKEEPYQLSEQEKELEKYRTDNLECLYCPIGGPPKVGVPFIGMEKQLLATSYGQKLLQIPQAEKDQELTKLLEDHIDFFWWHIRTHVAIAALAKANSNKLLRTAILRSDYMLVALLLHHGANPNENQVDEIFYNEPPIFHAKNKQIAELLVNYGADVHKKIDGDSVLYYMLQYAKDINLIRYLLIQKKVPIDSCNTHGNTLLHAIALHCKHIDNTLQKTELLLYNGVPLDVKNNYQETAEDILNRKLSKKFFLYTAEVNYWLSHQQPLIYEVLTMIQEQRERRAKLPQKWKTFGRCWAYEFKNEGTNLLSWLPAEIMMLIKEFVKAPPYKINREDNT